MLPLCPALSFPSICTAPAPTRVPLLRLFISLLDLSFSVFLSPYPTNAPNDKKGGESITNLTAETHSFRTAANDVTETVTIGAWAAGPIFLSVSAQ